VFTLWSFQYWQSIIQTFWSILISTVLSFRHIILSIFINFKYFHLVIILPIFIIFMTRIYISYILPDNSLLDVSILIRLHLVPFWFPFLFNTDSNLYVNQKALTVLCLLHFMAFKCYLILQEASLPPLYLGMTWVSYNRPHRWDYGANAFSTVLPTRLFSSPEHRQRSMVMGSGDQN
jgi:hypothetical protein